MQEVQTKNKSPLITTPRLVLRIPEPREAELVVAYYLQNKDHLEASSPTWEKDYFEINRWRRQLETTFHELINDQSLKLFIFEKGVDSAIIGSANFSNIVRRSAQYCNLGYGLAENKQGHGFMTEALEHAINYVFQTMNIHRVMANYMPHNVKSGRVLKRLGFVPEGYARDYLYINGNWEDHILTSRTNPNWDNNRA